MCCWPRKSDRLRDLAGIAAHGSVPQFKLTDVGVDVAEVTARREDLRVALAQSERRLVEAEIALAKTQLEHSVDIDRELAATQQEIDDSTQAIASMQAVTRVLRDGTSDTVSPRVSRRSVPQDHPSHGRRHHRHASDRVRPHSCPATLFRSTSPAASIHRMPLVLAKSSPVCRIERS